MKKNTVKYIINTMLGAAMLAGAVAVGIFLLREADAPAEQSGTDASAAYQQIKDLTEGDLQAEVWGASHIPSATAYNDSVMEGESGWYLVGGEWDVETHGYHQQMRYMDAATGEQTVLCVKPQCTHDTEYCTASNSRYPGVAQVYYEGFLYGLSTDTTKVPSWEHVDEEEGYYQAAGDILLMRYAPDGTTLEKLLSFEKAIPEPLDEVTLGAVEMIAHRGGLWISVIFVRERCIRRAHETGMEEQPYSYYWESSQIEYGYGLFHYDIRNDKLTAVIYESPKEKYSPTAPFQLRGMGDHVYFLKSNTDWADPYNGDRLYRVNIRTGELEKLREDVWAFYGLTEDSVVYLQKANTLKNTVVYDVYIMDIATGQSRLFLEQGDYVVGVQCTEDYVFAVKFNEFFDICIYDWNGDLLQTIEQPMKQPYLEAGMPFDINACCYPCISGDRLYVMSQYKETNTHCTDFSDAAEQGMVSWRQIY